MFLRIVLVWELVSLSFLVCFNSIRTEFSGRIIGELHTKETVKKVWWQGTEMICYYHSSLITSKGWLYACKD